MVKNSLPEENTRPLLEQAVAAIQRGSWWAAGNIVYWVLRMVGYYPKMWSPEEIDNFLRISYGCIFDFRKNNEGFWPAIDMWITLCFCPEILDTPPCTTMLKYHSDKIMKESELLPGLAALLAKTLDGFLSLMKVSICIYCQRIFF